MSLIRLPVKQIASTQSSWHLFVVRSQQRDELQKYMANNGIATVIHYPIPPHLQPAYAEYAYTKGDFPTTEALHSQVLSLPIGPHLTLDQASVVVDVVNRYR